MAAVCKLVDFASHVMADGTVQVCVIASCELDMSNSQHCTKSFVFVEIRDKKKTQAHLFSSRPWLATSQMWCQI